MKKLYILTFVLLTGLTTKAQYTITAATNPIVGDIKEAYLLNTAGFSIGTGGGSGLGQVWNYTSLDLAGAYSYFTTYTTVASTPMAATFTAANIASYDSDSPDFISYDNYSLTKSESIGEQIDLITSFVDINRLVFNYPFAYGNTQTDDYSYTYPGLSSTGTVTSIGDGVGTLNLPNGKTFLNALKRKTIEYEIVNDAMGTTTSTTTSYTWYNASTKFPLFFIATDVTTDVSGTTTTTVIYMDKSAYSVGLNERGFDKVNFTAYPNPTKNILNISFTNLSKNSINISITNLLGQVVLTEQANSTSIALNVDTLDTGTYFITVTDSNGITGVQKIFKQ